jgi:hypothetical protein
MNQIEKQVDQIIVRLKMLDELKGVRFVREYGTHYIFIGKGRGVYSKGRN